MDPGDPMYRSGPNFSDAGWRDFSGFVATPRENRLLMEATVHNIYQRTALDAFSRADRPPHVVICLRCPAEQIRSSFYFAQHNFRRISSALCFPQFVELLLDGDETALAHAIPDRQVFDILRRSLPRARYVDWIRVWTAALPAVQLIEFNELRLNPHATVEAIGRALGIAAEPWHNLEFPVVNPTRHYRFPRLNRTARALSRRYGLRNLRRALHPIYRKVQAPDQRTAVDRAEVAALQDLARYFHSANQQLSREFSVPVSHWWQPA